jgi:hypothetical protein
LRAQRTLLAWLLENAANPGRLSGYAMRRAQEALSLAGTLRRLRTIGPSGTSPGAHGLLATAIEERSLECANLALHAMEALEDAATVGRVRAAVASGDARHFARAIEALEGLGHPHITVALRKTLENIRGDVPLDAPSGMSPQSLAQILDYLSQYPDAFLRECARYAQPAAEGARA